MQNRFRRTSGVYTYGYRSDAPERLVSAILTFIGALTVAAMLVRYVYEAASGWSATVTAKRCFYYPDSIGYQLDKDDFTQILLSAAFFGNDALYFDSGEENTGISETDIVRDYDDARPLTPSEGNSALIPEAPLGSQSPEPSTPAQRDIYEFDKSIVPEGELAVIPYDLTLSAGKGEVLLSNTTGYSIEPEAYLDNNYPIPVDLSQYSSETPLVLIVHTHGTEAYTQDGKLSVSPSQVMRSSDTDENVVVIGEIMANILNDAGIPTIHVPIMHDLESYRRSYDLTADTIQQYLKKYPSISYVFDVHRDAIYTSDGDLVRPITEINGEICAQVMLVVGTNEKGADHPNWETNFTVAAKLQSRLTETYERFARPINIRGASFNEQFTDGSLLIEIGSAANSLTEAKNAAEYLSYAIVDMIKDNQR